MKSGNDRLTSRDRAIVSHIIRYKITFNEVIRHLYFGNADPQKVMDRLRKRGFIESISGFGGNRRAYGLGAKGQAQPGTNGSGREGLGSQSAPEYLTILMFCFLTKTPRALLNREEMTALFGVEHPVGRFHCIEIGAPPFVHNVYTPGPTKKSADIVAKTRAHVVQARTTGDVATWIDSGLYRYAVLVDSAQRASALNKAFDEALSDDGRRLRDAAQINVYVIPNPTELGEALHAI